MSTTYRITIACDEHAAPDCHREWVETHAELARLDGLFGALFRRGWVRGYRGDGSGQTHDLCPACAALGAALGVALGLWTTRGGDAPER